MEKYIDFNSPQDLTNNKPVWFTLFEEGRYVSTWTGLYVAMCSALLQYNPDYFYQEALSGGTGKGSAWISKSDKSHLLAAPKPISDKYWIATNFDSNTIVKNIRRILDACNIDYEDVVICYKKRGARANTNVNVHDFHYTRKDEQDFYVWLKDEMHLSESTSKSYISVIRKVESYIQKNLMIVESIYDDYIEDADEMLEALLENEDFLRKNTGFNHQIKPAVKKLLIYKESNYKEVFFPDTDIPEDAYEGAVQQVNINKYERSAVARKKCIEYFGCRCIVCGIDFAEKYGKLGEGFIHVHHRVPLNEIDQEYAVDFRKDLVPVCPNCHAMLHRKINGKSPSVEELREILAENY